MNQDNNGVKLLTLCRHGNTQWNDDFDRIAKIIKSGGKPDKIIISSNPELSLSGFHQAKVTGEWLREHHPHFDYYYTADKIRHLQTVSNLDIPGSNWYVTHELREQNFGIFDLLKKYRGDIPENEVLEKLQELAAHSYDFHSTPIAGESFGQLSSRIERLINKLKYGYQDKEVFFLTSENTAWAIRERLEHLGQKKYEELRHSKDPKDQFQNAGLTFWSRTDPKSGNLSSSFRWTRNVVPWNMAYSTEWREFHPLQVDKDTIGALIEHQRREAEDEIKKLESK